MVFVNYLSKLTSGESALVTSILELVSPEMNLVVDYFATFLEQGRTREW